MHQSKKDRLTERSRDRLEVMVQSISESRDPEMIVTLLRSEILNIVYDYNLGHGATNELSKVEHDG